MKFGNFSICGWEEAAVYLVRSYTNANKLARYKYEQQTKSSPGKMIYVTNFKGQQ